MKAPRCLLAGVAVLLALAVGCSSPPAPTPTEKSEAKKSVAKKPSNNGRPNTNTPGTETPSNTDPAPKLDTVPVPSSSPGNVTVTECGFDGVQTAINAAKGKVVLIDCWATWCGPCVASFPKLVEKNQKYAEKGLAVISVSLDQPAAAPKVLEFLQKQNATFTNLHLKLDAAGEMSLQQQFAYKNAIPHAVLFDKKGERVWAGHPLDPQLQTSLDAELAK